MDIIIVCHTEFGFVKDKKIVFEKKAIGGTSEGVLNLAKLADKYKAKVTFVVMPEVAEFFPKQINHEVGLHIHPGWEEFEHAKVKFFVGDKYLKENCKQSTSSTALKDYSYQEQFDMIKTGKNYVDNVLGSNVTSFVAGRWSENNDTMRALIKNGFTHDCSATPSAKPYHHDWSKLPRICMPYHPDENDYQKKGKLPLLIVPVSQFFPHGGVNVESMPFYGFSWFKACFLEYYRQDAPLFHICLHSPSMTDNYFISAMDNLLSFIKKHKNINFKYAGQITEYPKANYKTDILPYIFGINSNVIELGLKKIL